MSQKFNIRNVRLEEFEDIGELMVSVYSQLDDFPKKTEQPDYYNMLLNVGELTKNEHTELIVAISQKNKVVGAVEYFSDLKNYGSGGVISKIQNASGFRLFAVDPLERGNGLGKMLTYECIYRAKISNKKQVYIHSTKSMQVAWSMYGKLGFSRFPDIDFMQEKLSVYGFKLNLD
ncbi:GNAT family N-acetyltransferase [Dokdonia sp. Hel_I_53]|uniref:GNAT family N-acetyltransferase n=1 Tax=Dokdonia sp. Hel_I_53 TaxID=1566287 RepID=UPI00119BB9F6|nr:GNAT family N-acetyltransferase [Dokdonia sp. Hel_I_53]TVZ51572.1 ribosomal protein S18 acetylase RimI-like enzyme [Dokdonia sp. Hel_I_53]